MLRNVEEQAGMERLLSVFCIILILIDENMIGLFVIMIILMEKERMKIY
jgi:hypothetical protein